MLDLEGSGFATMVLLLSHQVNPSASADCPGTLPICLGPSQSCSNNGCCNLMCLFGLVVCPIRFLMSAHTISKLTPICSSNDHLCIRLGRCPSAKFGWHSRSLMFLDWALIRFAPGVGVNVIVIHATFQTG